MDWCTHCQRWLRSSSEIHTCYEAQPKLVRMSTESGTKLHLALDKKPLCSRGIWYVGGHLVTTGDLTAKLNLCINCKRKWLKMAHFRDF